MADSLWPMSLGRVYPRGYTPSSFELPWRSFHRYALPFAKGQPSEFDFLCIFALLIFLRANVAFGRVMLEFFGRLVNFDFPGAQDALRRGSTIFRDVAFCNVTKALFEQIVSFFFFLLEAFTDFVTQWATLGRYRDDAQRQGRPGDNDAR